MDTLLKINAALVCCENELQKIAAEALATGDYDTARIGLRLAEEMADQRTRIGAEPHQPNTRIESIPAKQKRPASPESTKKKQSKPSKKAGKSAAYPFFIREADKLIKVGWSKKSRTEYQHKAPRSAVTAFADHLRKNTKGGRIFTMDDLMPVPDPISDEDLPGYQVYLVLAWLRALGFASKHGRDGYSIEPSKLAKNTLAQAWEQLQSTP